MSWQGRRPLPGRVAREPGSIEYNGKTGKIEPNYDTLEEPRDFEFCFAPLLASSTGARFYAPYRSSVAAFSSASGECLWPDPPKLQGSVAQMQETPSGLLVRTIDAATDIRDADVRAGRGLGARRALHAHPRLGPGRRPCARVPAGAHRSIRMRAESTLDRIYPRPSAPFHAELPGARPPRFDSRSGSSLRRRE